MHIALAFYVIGLVTRDGLWLRIYLLIGSVFYILYYAFVFSEPLWDAIVVSAIIGSTNIIMIIAILRERTRFGLSQELEELLVAFPTLTPGQLRRLIGLSSSITASSDTNLTQKGENLGLLYFTLSGEFALVLPDGEYVLELRTFIGEIAFLSEQPASANVVAKQGSVYLQWNMDELKKVMRKSPNFSNALIARFNFELAAKLSRSEPSRD